MRRYYISIVGDLPAKKIRNWGAYLHNLKKHGSADKKVLHTLEQIKDLYRNPILHPETRLSLDESLSLVGLAENLVSLMVKDVPTHELLQSRALDPIGDTLRDTQDSLLS